MRTLPAALAAAALLAGCGRPLLSAQLEVPEIRIVAPARAFPLASPGAENVCDLLPGAGTGCLKVDLSYDVGAEVPVFEEEGVSVDLRLTDVALRLTADPGGATVPVSDFRGVEEVVVLVQRPDGSWLAVASYVKPAGAAPASVTVSGRSNLDLSPFLSGGTLAFRVELTYDAADPPPSFFADVEAGFSLVATVDYRDAFL